MPAPRLRVDRHHCRPLVAIDGALISPMFLRTSVKSSEAPGWTSRLLVPDCDSEVMNDMHSSRYAATRAEEMVLTPSEFVRFSVVATDTVQLRDTSVLTPTEICWRGAGSPPITSGGSRT